MTQFEKAEISRLPQKYKPMGAWGYFWYSILFLIPVIGLIPLIVCANSDKNISRRCFARGVIIGIVAFVIVLVLVAAAAVVLYLTGILTQIIPASVFDWINKTFGIAL